MVASTLRAVRHPDGESRATVSAVVIVNKMILPSLAYRLTHDLYAYSIVINDNGKERSLTPREVSTIANGYRVFLLGPVSS